MIIMQIMFGETIVQKVKYIALHLTADSRYELVST